MEYVARGRVFVGKERRGRLPLGSDTWRVMREVSEELAGTARVYEPVWSITDFKEWGSLYVFYGCFIGDSIN